MSKRMTKRFQKIFSIQILLIIVFLGGCDKISIPRLSFESKPETKARIAVIYRFDPALTQHTQVVDACGLPYTIKTGEIISQTFLEIGQEHFASVSTDSQTSDGTSPGPANALTIDLKFVGFNFEPIGRSGEEDQYLARVGLQLRAVYQDTQGNALAQTPLTYEDTAKLWTPALTSQSTSCATGRFDGAVEDAAEALALDMTQVIPQLYGQAPPQPSQEVDGYAAQFPSQSPPTQQPSVSFRTMLQDANDNLVLEGGEKLTLQIEATNTSPTTLPSAYVEIRGSQAIIDAFSQFNTLPISIGPLQAGEKKSTEIRGRMPAQMKEEKGELMVSISLSQGIPPGPRSIIATIKPGTGTSLPETSSAQGGNRVKDNQGLLSAQKPELAHSPYYAIIIGLDEYQDSWPDAHQVTKRQLQSMADALLSARTFPRNHIKVLNGKKATRANIEKTLFSWAKNHLTSDAIVLLYFAGHVLVDSANGEVYLVPYEGSRSGSKKRLISLRSLQRVLHKLQVKLSLLFLDTPVAHYLGKNGDGVARTGSKQANWHASIPLQGESKKNTHLIQIRRLSGNPNLDSPHLLSGLLGNADQNLDETVTLAELLISLEERTEVIPSISQYSPLNKIPLAE